MRDLSGELPGSVEDIDMKAIEAAKKHKKCMEELRYRVKSIISQEMYDDDNVFERFLIARNHDINAAETMLRDHIQWRKSNKIDTIVTDFVATEVLEKHVSVNVIGHDKEGRPVIYIDAGGMDTKGILKSAKKANTVKYIVQYFEKVVSQMKGQTKSNPVNQWIFVMNFDNYSLSMATHKESLEFWISIASIYDANYPERLKAAYIINASVYFTIGWAVVKPCLPGATLRKIQVYGKDGWKQELLKVVDSSNLPVFLGGTQTDPDGNPMCNTCIRHGIKVPEHFYLKKQDFLSEHPDAGKLSVGRMSKMALPLDVRAAGSHIEWLFDVRNKDIGFAVLYKGTGDSAEEPEEVVPRQKVDTNLAPEEGLLKCEKPGVYILEFDNSNSWIFTKEVYYKASVRNP